MRFIGSKAHLLKKIDEILLPNLTGKEKTFVDLFAGSNSVAQYYKGRYAVTSNDLLAFSNCIAKGTIELNTTPTFGTLRGVGITDPLKYLQSTDLSKYDGDFITKEYSPAGPDGRMYFTIENAKRIDFIRNTIDKWHTNSLINEQEFYYILSILLQAVPFVSNITGTYGAYLKHWDKRSFKKIELIPTPIINNHHKNKALNMDAVILSKQISGDILYIDTPYNNRQYAPNYHILETIALNDHPTVHGVTGQRDNREKRSDFAMKSRAKQAMIKLLTNLNFSHVVVSYSTDGIIPEDELKQLITDIALDGHVIEKRIPYRKYKSKIINPDDELYELLFYFQPAHALLKKKRAIVKSTNIQTSLFKDTATISTVPSSGFIKSPLNYIGGKYKLLPQLFQYLPKHADKFIDLFSGGGNVGINVNADTVFFNDLNSKINELFRYFQGQDPNTLITKIQKRITDYDLSKTNEKNFLKFRADYNAHQNPLDLYVLAAYSFNYQFRFNNSMEYNNPFGRNRSHFSESMANHLIRFVSKLNILDAHFTDYYFTDFDMSTLTKKSFVYADPPYLITTGSYNDGNRGFKNWTSTQEKELYQLLDDINDRGIHFALSNVTDHKGKSNDILKEWIKKYHVHVLNYNYKNSSHNTTALDSREILVTNY
ncbi:Dam family site-specific DNA-(adenine-N6)-methyltransferase [Loigolactobacillus coryniformis]|uniref:Dam family site-specific DNA-(adenine-N6)-methyltransferase n=1 Tax=Loigolactobacillus coryniformis TaxID=1610 RepID=UPI00345CCEF2